MSVGRRFCLAALSAAGVAAQRPNIDFFVSLWQKAPSFGAAQQLCAQQGGRVAAALDAAENEAILKTFTEGFHQEIERVYIGASDMGHEGNWIWTDGGEQVDYSSWAPGQPDHGNGPGGEDCVEQWTNGQWNDCSCFDTKAFVCEVPTPPENIVFSCSPAMKLPGGKCTYELSWKTNGKYGEQKASVHAASQACKAHGHVLAEPRDHNAIQWLGASLRKAGFDSIWVAGTDAGHNNHWKWLTSKDDVKKTFWAHGQPDDDGDCIEMWPDGSWNDRDCSVEKVFACEIQAKA